MNFYKPEMLYDFVLSDKYYVYFSKTRSYNFYETWFAYVDQNRILKNVKNSFNEKFLNHIMKPNYLKFSYNSMCVGYFVDNNIGHKNETNNL